MNSDLFERVLIQLQPELAQEFGLAVLEDRKRLKAFEIIKKKEVNVRNFKEILIKQEWAYEQYLDEENDPNTSGHQFAYKLLTQEEFDLLKEVLL